VPLGSLTHRSFAHVPCCYCWLWKIESLTFGSNAVAKLSYRVPWNSLSWFKGWNGHTRAHAHTNNTHTHTHTQHGALMRRHLHIWTKAGSLTIILKKFMGPAFIIAEQLIFTWEMCTLFKHRRPAYCCCWTKHLLYCSRPEHGAKQSEVPLCWHYTSESLNVLASHFCNSWINWPLYWRRRVSRDAELNVCLSHWRTASFWRSINAIKMHGF